MASGGITASPLPHIPFPPARARFGGTPGRVTIFGAAGVGDAFIVEGEDTMITSSGFAVCGPGITCDVMFGRWLRPRSRSWAIVVWAVSPRTRDVLAVGVSLCGTPRLSVSVNGGAVGDGVAPELEGEDTSRARIIATDGDTATTVNIVNGYFFIIRPTFIW